MRVLALTVVAVIVVSGCDTLQTKEGQGAVFGGLAGAAIGSQVGHGWGTALAMTAGVVGGALLGQHLGSRLDKADRYEQQQAAAQAFESAPAGQSVPWNNPDTGHSGQITPTHTYQQNDGTYCREFSSKVVIEGEAETVYGTACRNPDGTWRTVG